MIEDTSARVMEVVENPRDLVIALGVVDGEYCGWTIARGPAGEGKVLIEYPGNIRNSDKTGLLFHLAHIMNHFADQAFDSIRDGRVPDYLDRGMIGELVEHLKENDIARSAEILRPKPKVRTLYCWCGSQYYWEARTKHNAFFDGERSRYLAFCRSGHAINVETFYADVPEGESQPLLQTVLACTKCRRVLPAANDEAWKWKDKDKGNGEITCPNCHISIDVTDFVVTTIPVSFDDGYGHGGGAGGGHF